MKSELKVLKT